MPNYQRGQIYIITSPDVQAVYIGSTCENLNNRLSKHVRDYKLYTKGKCHYVSSYDIVSKPYYKITLIENYPCNSKKKLFIRETEWINKFGDVCVNKRTSYTDKKLYDRQYQKGNKRREYMKNYRASHKYKLYIDNNRDKINGYNKNYRDKNKNKLNEKSRQYYSYNKINL